MRRRHDRADALVALEDRLARVDGRAEGGNLRGRIGLAGVALEGGQLLVREPGDLDAMGRRLLLG